MIFIFIELSSDKYNNNNNFIMWTVRLYHDQFHDQIFWYSDLKSRSSALSELLIYLKHYKCAGRNDFIDCVEYMNSTKIEFGFYQTISGNKHSHVVEFEISILTEKTGLIDFTHIIKNKEL